MLTEGLTLIIFMLRTRMLHRFFFFLNKTRDWRLPAPSSHQITMKFSDESVHLGLKSLRQCSSAKVGAHVSVCQMYDQCE